MSIFGTWKNLLSNYNKQVSEQGNYYYYFFFLKMIQENTSGDGLAKGTSLSQHDKSLFESSPRLAGRDTCLPLRVFVGN